MAGRQGPSPQRTAPTRGRRDHHPRRRPRRAPRRRHSRRRRRARSGRARSPRKAARRARKAAGTSEATEAIDATAAFGAADGPPARTDLAALTARRSPMRSPPPATAGDGRRSVVFGALLVWGGIAWLAGDRRAGRPGGRPVHRRRRLRDRRVRRWERALCSPGARRRCRSSPPASIDIPWEGGVGDKRLGAAASISELQDSYELGIGEGTLDLPRPRAAAAATDAGRPPREDRGRPPP